MGRGTTQPASSAATTSTTPRPARATPAPTGRGAEKGGAHSLGGPSRFYAMRGCQSSEAPLDVVTDPVSTLSYVTPYIALEFGMEPEQLHEPFFISTPVGEPILAARVYRDCVVTVHGRDTMVDLVELGIVNFDVIMRMDWLYSCFAKLDC
ncbi:uncharacterized protein [Nicotiana tomentosiformis]|uniref:uncharacterized protein n=1 Tax=Nicotiana tomentosiformis TaxID=4098 RepID=UPI00388CE09F